MRLRTVGYSQAEYWLAFSNKGYIMPYQSYNISKKTRFKMEKKNVNFINLLNILTKILKKKLYTKYFTS